MAVKAEAAPKAKIQTPITVTIRSMSQAQIAQAHATAAMGIYMSNLPFNHYESPYILAHERTLHSSYKPPNRKLVAGVLLDQAYQTVKIKVDAELASSD